MYCNYKEQDEQNAQALVGSLAQQLAERHADVPNDLKALYDKHSRDRKTPTSPTISECFQLLKSQISSCPTTYLS